MEQESWRPELIVLRSDRTGRDGHASGSASLWRKVPVRDQGIRDIDRQVEVS